ncbi:MAG: hypothetical protein LBP62_07790 [Clostridiales bacterium]|nr:hypothetical protein [Clostridiales bacterium]
MGQILSPPLFPSVGGDQRGGANSLSSAIPLRGRGSKGWGEFSFLRYSPPWEGIKGVGRPIYNNQRLLTGGGYY